MEFTYETLAKDIGLKYNNEVHLGRDAVHKVIVEHPDEFRGWTLKPIQNSHMLYGYSKQGNPVKVGFDGDFIQRIVLVKKELNYQRYKGIMSYDGHGYAGYQVQHNQTTIQGELTRVVSSVNGEETLVQGASRTDAGVHAKNYVFHFDSTKSLTNERWREFLNYQLPNDMLVKSVEETHPLFHSRYDVFSKEYSYHIRTKEKDPFRIHYEWVVSGLNVSVLKEQLKKIEGTHDFSSFCKGEPDSTIRTIFETKCEVSKDGVILTFIGDGFLRYMIRILVYTLVEISKGKLNMDILEILDERGRIHTKHMAPATGLYLETINY
ncbi:MAG: tRNA pseudouridine(38-40) synthase TruA [Bacilli bacterium]|nr:tRNA pseudouridine(38-40) synthase TruA [Bacilli bacterium]MBN2876982.1 tRNA pseudouridine(38-40) synthase TruA [Bacilli bacterium]